MTAKIRLRFAPSPTGFLHIGNLRSALFGYLLSQSLGGKFIFRLEDTDSKREVEGSLEKILEITKWAGIEYDEGPHIKGDYGPYIQSERLEIYQKYIKELLDQGLAYYCFCTEERLTELRASQTQNKLAPKYDGHCRQLSQVEINQKIAAGEKYVIRQKMPESGEVKVFDELRGEISFKVSDLDDHVLLKSDGIPTYQFASVVDDHLMEITHVTRGEEWIPSFPKNILLYQAFGWIPPKFIHMPLLLNEGGGKMSKRKGDVFVEQFKERGYLSEALINFCALLGWHPQGEQELFTIAELKNVFTLKGMGTSPAIFNTAKLDFFNAHYIRQKTNQESITLCEGYVDFKEIINPEAAMTLCKERMTVLSDIKELIKPFTKEKLSYDKELLLWKTLDLKMVDANLREMKKVLEGTVNWETKALETTLIDHIKTISGKNGDYLWPLRVALCGEKNSPSPFELLWALGKEISMARIEQAIELCQ